MTTNGKVKTVRTGKKGRQPASVARCVPPGAPGGQKRQRAEAELEISAGRRAAALARLGRDCMAGVTLSVLLDKAVSVTADCLRAEYCGALELLPDASAFTLRAGVGWKKGVVGQTTVSANDDSQAGYTLLRTEPVVVEDLSAERRFAADPLLHDHGVVSGMSVVIRGQRQPFGVLSVHAARRREFVKDDVAFLQDVAEMLATSIERKRAEEDSLLFASIFDSMQVGLAVWYLKDPNDAMTLELVSTNPALAGSDPALLQAGVAEICAEVVRSGKGKEIGGVRCGGHDGPQTVFLAKAFPLPNNHVGVAFEDITERKRAEEEIRSLNMELERRVAEQEHSILELSTPVVRLWNEIVLLPLIGEVDTTRAKQLIEALLDAIVETQSRVAILDITGVPGMDTSVAQHLIKTVAAAKMLGADVIVTGVSPEAAQALVRLGVDLGGMRIHGTLRAGLAEALCLIGRRVVSV